MNRYKKVVITLVVLFSFVTVGCGTASVKPGMFKGRIIFRSHDRGSSDIYMVNADGTKLHAIHTNSAYSFAPSFSPDRKKIVFEGDKGVHIVDIYGRNEKILISSRNTISLYRPKWISENIIFYVGNGITDNKFSIYRNDMHQNKEQKVLDSAGSYHFSVSWDGRYLAYESTPDRADILVKDLKTGETINLTKENGKYKNQTPAWSPDGKKIAFTSNRDGHSEIYIMDNNGKNVKKITNNRWYDGSPAWSPDGTKLVYSSRRKGELLSGFELFITDLKDMKEWRLTKAKDRNGRPSSDTEPIWVE